MATKQTVISATASSSLVVPQNQNRRQLYIRNYFNAPGTLTPQTHTMYVMFKNGGPATAGGAGEIEIIPGGEYTFGGPLPPSTKTLPGSFFLPNCPTEDVYVITEAGNASGCILEQ